MSKYIKCCLHLCALNITEEEAGQCNNMHTAKLYHHTIQNKGSQVIDTPASALEGLRCREIAEYGKQLQLI